MSNRDSGRRSSIRRGVRLFLALLLALVAAPHASAQGESIIIPVDFQTIGLQGLAGFDPALLYRPIDMLSVRPGGDALGMGGAGTATATGVMALGWNPAGLAAMDRAMISLDGVSLSTSGVVKDYPDSFFVPQSPPLLITSYDVNLKGAFHSNFLAVGAPILRRGAIRAAGAISWRRFANVTFPEETIGEFQLPQLTGFPVVISLDRSESGGIDAFTAGLGLELGSRLAVGASLNVLDGTWRANADNRLTVVGPPYRGRSRAKLRFSGAVPELGIRLVPTERLQIAARFRPAFDLEARGGTYYSRSIPFPEQPVTVLTAKIADYDLSVPSALSAGIAVRPIPRLLLAVEMNSQKWGEAKADYREPVNGLFPQQDGDLPLTDVDAVAFGAEYLLREFSWASVPVRVGFRNAPQGFRQVAADDMTIGSVPTEFGPLPVPAHTGEFHGSEVSGSAYTFGFSLLTEGIRYDLGVESISISFDKWLFDSPYDPLANPRAVRVKTDRSTRTLRLSASYLF